MEIKEIVLPAPHKRYLTKGTRCSRVVWSSGNGVSGKRSEKCRRYATYKIDGIKFCTQHAGEASLRYLLTNASRQPPEC